jgi:hypothetical protein
LNDEGWCSSCDKLHETKRPLCPKCGDYLIFASDDVVEPNPPQGTLSDEQLVRWAYVRNLEKLCHERSKDGIEITVPDYDYRMLAKDIWQAAQAATVGVQEGALDAAWAKHCLVAYGEVVPLGKTMFRAGWQAAQSANTAAFNEGVEAATQWLIEDGRWPHGRTVQGIRRLKRIAPKTKDGE